MVIRKRLRSILVPLALYSLSGGIAAFFVFHAHHGQRGLEAKRAYKEQIVALNGELALLKNEHVVWDRRLALMASSAIDKDLLEEQARVVLGRVHRNDAVILLGRDGRAK